MDSHELINEMIDIHTHILPGVDDGANDFDMTMQMLKMANEQGITCTIATPHFSPEQDIAQLRELRSEVALIAKKIDPNYHIILGQEILYFEGIVDCLKEGLALTLGESRYVLVEFMPQDSFQKIIRAVRQLQQAAYIPVIAHVERYRCVYEVGRLEELQQSGAWLQMNYGSLTGGFFDRRTRWCKKQIKAGNIQFLGTDMHNTSSRAPEITKAIHWIETHMGVADVIKLTYENPKNLLVKDERK